MGMNYLLKDGRITGINLLFIHSTGLLVQHNQDQVLLTYGPTPFGAGAGTVILGCEGES